MKNLKTTEKKAKSVDEAIDLALSELGIDKDDAEIEIIDEGSKGFLGIRLTYTADIADNQRNTGQRTWRY